MATYSELNTYILTNIHSLYITANIFRRVSTEFVFGVFGEDAFTDRQQLHLG